MTSMSGGVMRVALFFFFQSRAIDVRSIPYSVKCSGHIRIVIQSCGGGCALDGLRGFYFLLFTTVHELLNIILGISLLLINSK